MPDQPSFDTANYPALGIRPIAQPSTGGGIFDTIGQFANIQNALNQNRLFQQTFAARQRAGQIIAAAPDLETGLQALFKDPQVAPFAGDMVNSVRQSQEVLTRIQGEQQTQAQSGLEAIVKSFPAILAAPEQANNIISAQMATLSPVAQQRDAPAVNNILGALTEPTPGGAPVDRATLNKRLVGILTSAGYTPEVLSNILGTTQMVNLGGRIQPGLQLPAAQGGGFQPAGAPQQMSLAPGISFEPVGPGGSTVPFVYGGGAGSGWVPTTGSNLGQQSTGPRPVAQGPSISEAAAAAKTGDEAGDLAAEMSARAETLPNAINRLNIMSNALAKFQAGGGADARTGFAQALQAAKNIGVPGIDQELIDKVGNQSLSNSQLFDAEVKPLAISELKEAAQGTGRVMRSEVDAFLQMMDKTKDPATLMQLLNQGRYALQVGYDQSQKYVEFKQMLARKDPSVAGLDTIDFMPWYMHNFRQENLPANAGSLNLAPLPLTNALGVAQPGPSLRWNPSTRKLEKIGQ